MKHKDSYCLIIIKWFDPTASFEFLKDSSFKAFQYASTLHADFVNFSAGGANQDIREKVAIETLLNRGVKVFVAAGNDGQDLDKDCNYFPACDRLPKLNVIGNMRDNTHRAYSSNYGRVVTQWQIGQGIVAYDGYNLRSSSGTSQATAIALSKAVNRSFK